MTWSTWQQECCGPSGSIRFQQGRCRPRAWILPTWGDAIDGAHPLHPRSSVEVTCLRCREARVVRADHFVGFERGCADAPDVLARRVLRDPRTIDGERDLWTRIADGTATTEERIEHIVRAIRAVDRRAARRLAPGSLSVLQALGVIALLLTVPLPFVAHHVGYGAVPIVVASLPPTLLLWWFAAGGQDGRRAWARRHAAPAIARGVRPLRPTVGELQAALDQTHLKAASNRLAAVDLLRVIGQDQDQAMRSS